MKTSIKISILLILLTSLNCSKDDLVEIPKAENQPPDSFSATVEISKNIAQLNWTAAIDPDGDSITYRIMLGDSLVGSQSETTIDLTDLVFEKDYNGKIIDDDSNGHQIEISFSFTTGFLWLTNFEFIDFPSSGRRYEYNDNEKLITLNRPGNSINVVYDEDGKLFSYDYFTYEWNGAEQFTKLRDGSGNGDFIVLYNDQNKPKELKVTRTGSNNFNSDVTAMLTYNGLGRLVVIDIFSIYSSDSTDGEQKFYQRIGLGHDNIGNITEMITRISDNGLDYKIHAFYEYSYDDKKNPWNAIIDRQFKLNASITLGINQDLNLYTSPIYIGGYELHVLLSEHNVTNTKYYNSDLSLIDERLYEYSYNASGYPSTGKITAIEEDGQEEIPISFYYLE